MSVALATGVGRRHVTVTRHASAIGCSEMAVGASHPSVRPYAAVYVGWTETMVSPVVRREMPTEYAPLMFSFGAPIRLYDLSDRTRYSDVGSFITGAYDASQLVGSAGTSGAVQVNLTLLGIRRIVGRPLADLKNRAVPLDDVFGPRARELSEQIAEARSWEARFELVDQFLAARLALDSRIPREVQAAWRALVSPRGQVRIRDVAQDVGWSHKHLIDRFRAELGLSPKGVARILRFGRVVQTLKAGPVPSLAELALACGYYDQAHLHRDARKFAGVTPGELVTSLLPDHGGFLA